MDLIELFEIDCVYNNIIKFLDDTQSNKLRCVCKTLNQLLECSGYLKNLELKCDNIEELIESHNTYYSNKRFIQNILVNNENEPLCKMPKISKCNLYINQSKINYYDNSIDCLTNLILTETEVDLYEISLCQNLESLSIYNIHKNIIVKQECIFNKLKQLFIIGNINLEKIKAKNLLRCYFKGRYNRENNYNNFINLKEMFIVTDNILNKFYIKNVVSISLLYKNKLYCNKKIKINKEYINIFLNNCNINSIENINVIEIDYNNDLFFIK